MAGGGTRHRAGVGGRQARAALVPGPAAAPSRLARAHPPHPKPRAEVITYVHAVTGTDHLSRYDNLAEATGRATVFLPEPHGAGPRLRALSARTAGAAPSGQRLRPREASPASAASGGSDGRARVSTRLTRSRLSERASRLLVSSAQRRLRGGLGLLPRERGHRLPGAARLPGRRAASSPSRPRVDARGTRDDNSWYSPGERTLTFGTGRRRRRGGRRDRAPRVRPRPPGRHLPRLRPVPGGGGDGRRLRRLFAGSFFAARKPAALPRHGDELGRRARRRHPARESGGSTRPSPTRASTTARTPTSTRTGRSGRPPCGTSGRRPDPAGGRPHHPREPLPARRLHLLRARRARHPRRGPQPLPRAPRRPSSGGSSAAAGSARWSEGPPSSGTAVDRGRRARRVRDLCPHEQASQTRPSAVPPSSSPHRRCSSRNAMKEASTPKNRVAAVMARSSRLAEYRSGTGRSGDDQGRNV